MRLGKLIASTLCAGCIYGAAAQTPPSEGVEGDPAPRRLTMRSAIMMAQEQSIASMVAKNTFAAFYWQNRSYLAERLPSLNVRAGVANVNREMVPLQNAETGAINYRPVFTLSNDVSLFVEQKISATGGTFQLTSSLRRLDQFDMGDPLSWYSQPITLSYIQPLVSYNAMKWAKRIEPHVFERAKLEYLEAMEQVTILATMFFWNAAMAELNRDIAVGNHENSKQLYGIARERHKVGAIGRDELLQLELRVLTDSLAINSAVIDHTSAHNTLASYIGLREETAIELDMDYDLPGISLDYDRVLAMSLENSSFELNRQIAILEAERGIARARGNRGIDISFNARFGLSQSDRTLGGVYSRLRDQQVAGFTVGIPILDWGVGRGRVRMAQSEAATVRYQQEQERIDFEQELFVAVMRFNSLEGQCEASRRASEIADERFTLAQERFVRGSLSVTDLGVAQTERDNARRDYLTNLSDYWNAYYTLRRTTLYDWMSGTNIDARFDQLIEE